MKKSLLYVLAAMAFIVGACQKENSLGNQADVTFTVDLPVELSTKAIGDGTSATELYYAVFSQKGEYVQSLAQTAPVPVVGKTATLELKLVRNYTYSLVFWAQAPGAPYTFTPETGTVAVDYAGKANDETRDAFCKMHTFTVPDAATFDENVTLKRPFAQINFGAADFGQITELGLDMTSTVTISGLADTYDILNGVVSGDASTQLALNTVPAQFNPAESLTVQGKQYGYVSMNYILAPVNEYDTDGNVIVNQKELANVSATFAYNNADVQIDVPNVPYQRNFRTNIIGTFYTNEVAFTIVVDENFYEPSYDYVLAKTADDLAAALAQGGKVVLGDDIALKSHVDVKQNTVLDLNGKTISTEGEDVDAIWVRDNAELVITGNGTINATYDAVFATGSSKVTIENGTFVGVAEAVFAQANAQVVINGGSFKSLQYPGFTLNLKDSARATASILVNGGSFYQFNPADNAAEGEHTSFVAAGKTVSQDGEWFVVE